MTHYLYNHFHIFIPLYENTNYQNIIDKFNKQYYSNYSIYFISSKNIVINHPYIRVVTIDQNINHTILQTCKKIPVNDLVVVLEDVEHSLNTLWLHKMNQYFLRNKPILLFDKNNTHYWIVKGGIFVHILNHGNEKDDLKQLCFEVSHENIHNYDMNNDIFEKVESKNSVKTEIHPLNNEIHLLLATYKRNKNVPLVLNMLKTQTVKNIHLHLLDNNEDTNTQKELDSLLDPFYKQLTISLHRYNKNLHCFGRISVVKEIIQHHMMDYIVIFDDDQIYRETWLQDMIYNVKPLSTLSWYGKIFKVCDYWKSTLWYNEIEKMVRPEVKEWSYFGPGGSMIDIQLFLFEELYQYEKYSQDIRAIDDIWMSFVFKKYLNIPFHRNITHPKCCIDANKLQKMTWANIKDKKSVLFKTLSKKYEWDVTKTTHSYYNINSFFDKIYVFCNDFTNLEKFRKHHICFKWVPYENYEKNVKQLLDQCVNQTICIFHENIQFREFYFYDCQKMVEKLHHGSQHGSFNSSMDLIETITYHPSFGIYKLRKLHIEKNNDNIYMKLNFTSTTESSNKRILCVCPIMNQSCSKIITYMMSQKNKNWGLLLINNNSNRHIKNEFTTMKNKYVSNRNIIFIENTHTLNKVDCLNSGLDFFHKNKNFTHFTWMSDCDEYYGGFVNNILKSFSNNVEFVYTNFYERFPGKKWADINGSSYKDDNDLLVNYKNNIATSAWSRIATEHIGKFNATEPGCEGFDYVYRTFTLLNPKQIVFDKGVTMTCRCKTHNQFPREIDHVQKYIHNKTEIYIPEINKIDMFTLTTLNDSILDIINLNLTIITNEIVNNYKNILFVCGDYPGYGGAATNCFHLQEHFKNHNINTFGFYFNFEKGENAKYENHNDYIIDDLNKLSAINFKPDLIILKSPISCNLKQMFTCPVYYLVGGIYKNELDKYYYNITNQKQHEKYHNEGVLLNISRYDKTYVNSSHTQELLLKLYNLKSDLFYSSFIPYYNKTLTVDPNFNQRKYKYGLIVSNFDRKVKNINESIQFLKGKKDVILIGTGSSRYTSEGFTCIDLIDINGMQEYYKQIKYIIQDSFFESCSNVKIESLFNGCKIHERKLFIFSSTQLPENGGAATNCLYLHEYVKNNLQHDSIAIFFAENPKSIYKNEKDIYVFSTRITLFEIKTFRNKILRKYNEKNIICLCKNVFAPQKMRQIFPLSKIIYLVAGSPIYTFWANMNNISFVKYIKTSINKEISENESKGIMKSYVLAIVNESKTIQICDEILTNSDNTRDVILHHYKDHINKLYNKNINTSNLKYDYPIISQQDFDKKDIDIIFAVSNHARVAKGSTIMNKIITNDNVDNLSKVIIGGAFEKVFNVNKIKNCLFFNQLSQSELFSYLKRSKILIIPSTGDASPNILYEGLHVGCNILLTKNCGNYELFPDISVLEDTDDIDLFIKHIYLLKHHPIHYNIQNDRKKFSNYLERLYLSK